jgi:hypothetical protein
MKFAIAFWSIGLGCALYGLFSHNELIGWFGALFISIGGLFTGIYASKRLKTEKREKEE